jgi:hypothetical protein
MPSTGPRAGYIAWCPGAPGASPARVRSVHARRGPELPAAGHIQDLGHDEPTMMLTNDRRAAAAALITRDARRMLIENALSDTVRYFHMNALASAVGLSVDFDMALLVIASGLYRLLASQTRGDADAQARSVYRGPGQHARQRAHRQRRGACALPSPVPPAHRRRLRIAQCVGAHSLVGQRAAAHDRVTTTAGELGLRRIPRHGRSG